MKIIIKKFICIISTWLAKKQVKQHGESFKVNFPCKFTNKTIVGNNCHFNGIHISGNGFVTIGDNFHSGKECLVITSFHNYDIGISIPYDNTYIDKDVTIGNNVWLGSRVILLGGVNIEDGVIIQAGSVVVNDIPYCAIAGGSPSKVFKFRDIEHYESLMHQGKFN